MASISMLPSFGDPNDEAARKIIQDLYTDRTVVAISMTEVLGDGGMMHCVTQQQPKISY